MNRQEKQQNIESLREQFRGVNSAFLINYRGLKVVDATELRRKIRGINGTYVVVKNTLALRAAKESKIESLASYFEGPTAGAYHTSDIVGLAKLLIEVSRTNPNIAVKVAIVEGKLVPATDLQAIASMPTREVMLGKLLFLLMAPVQRFATVLKAPLRDLGLVLNQIQKPEPGSAPVSEPV
jgi:large subunit ribosomal protein L10